MFYVLFMLKAVLITAAVIFPGIWLNTYIRKPLPIGYIPIPGIILLALLGLMAWVLPVPIMSFITAGLCILFMIGTASLLIKSRRDRLCALFSAAPTEVKLAVCVTLLVFAQAIAVGVNPLPIAQEFNPDTNIPGRMIASPPDHGIPHLTALYMHRRHDGNEHSKQYFGDWSISSRGPLVPLGINGLFQIFPMKANTPTNREVWPLSKKGEDVARIYGWLLNALVILGAFQLLKALKVQDRNISTGLVWLALAPVVLINTVFLWPKLLATYFFLLAIAAVSEQRPFLSGFLMALSWLSHPVGALLLPAFGLFLLFVPSQDRIEVFNIREKIRLVMPFACALAVTMAPWLVYKAYLGHPDAFMSYVLGGGAGTQRAPDVYSWLKTRTSNIWFTLVPGAFFYSNFMQVWIYGPVSDVLRWSIQYAKTLPGQLGLAMFVFAYVALLSKAKTAVLSSIKVWLLIASFFVMVIFWGFSNDGLGRNSLEPLTVLLIVFATSSLDVSRVWLPILLMLLALEGQWLQLSGFIYAEKGGGHIGAAASICFTISLFISFILVIIAIASRKSYLPLADRKLARG